MLKTRRGAQVWLITQSSHADLAGQMAAHWGNDTFAVPGYFAPSADPERLRREVVFAVAEHDTGWWEWEADPPLSAEDGLPQGLGEVVADPVAGMERWRLGVPRFSQRHPYASLLIGDHAYGLYAARFTPDHPPELTHHLLVGHSFYPSDQQEEAQRFMSAVREMQGGFRRRLEEDDVGRAACEPEQRMPHARLLQTLDALSLALCSAALAPVAGEAKGLGEDQIVFPEVPRGSWADRVSLAITPLGDGRIKIAPYPFDEAPLTVSVLARVVQPRTWWKQAPWILKRFTFSRQ
jgi:hypothetical protein